MSLGDKIVVANTGDDSLSIIDCYARMESCRIYMPLGSGPYALTKTKDPFHIMVSQYYGDSLLYIDLRNQKIEKSLYIGRRPSYMAADLRKNMIYITNMDSDSVSIVSLDGVNLTGQLSVGSMPQGIDCCPESEVLAIANTHSSNIHIINARDYSVIKEVKLEGHPFQVKFSLDGKRIFVGCSCTEKQSEGSIIMLNALDYSVECEIFLRGIPGQIHQTRDGIYILVTSMGEGGLQIISLKEKKIIRNIATNGMTHGIAVDMEERYAYVTNTDDNTVSIVDWKLGKRIINIKVGKEPNGILFIPDGP